MMHVEVVAAETRTVKFSVKFCDIDLEPNHHVREKYFLYINLCTPDLPRVVC